MTDRHDGENERYLLGTMTDEERNEFEERIFADDELFFELCEAENSLVDQYAAGVLGHRKLQFEAALNRNSALAVKAQNAKALKEFIRSERKSQVAATDEPSGMWHVITQFFSGMSPIPAMAMSGLLLLVTIGAVLLALENGRRNAEIARLEAELSKPSNSSAEVERELADLRAREGKLQTAIDGEKEVSGDLTADLARERDHRRRLERDLAAIRKPGQPETVPTGDATVTVLRLGDESSSAAEVPSINSEGGPRRLSVLISLPASVSKSERVSIRLNGNEIGTNVAIRQNAKGDLSVNAAVATSQLSAGENVITVHSLSGGIIASYRIQGND